MSTSKVKIVDKRKQKNLRKKKRRQLDADKKQEMLGHLSNDLQKYEDSENEIIEINYPVNEYPAKVKSLSFDKLNKIEGRLWGIKGQYLIFDDGKVLNIRKHNGYTVTLEV